MQFTTFANNRRRDTDVADGYTVYLNTGDPGGPDSAGTANRVPAGFVGSQGIAAGAAQWDVTTDGEATLANHLNFGNAAQAQAGVSHMSVFTDAGEYFAGGALAASMDFALGDPVIVAASSRWCGNTPARRNSD